VSPEEDPSRPSDDPPLADLIISQLLDFVRELRARIAELEKALADGRTYLDRVIKDRSQLEKAGDDLFLALEEELEPGRSNDAWFATRANWRKLRGKLQK
jgi:hypothetical protein